VLGDRFLEIGTVPVVDVRIALQSVQADVAVGVAADIEPVLIERGAEQLDLRTCGGLLGLSHTAEQPWPYQADEQAQHDDDHEQLDERDPPLVRERTEATVAPRSDRATKPSRASSAAGYRRAVRPGTHTHHNGMSLIEKIASSIATTMNATSTP